MCITENDAEFHAITSNYFKLWLRAVPWNSMEFHGTWSAPISMTRAIPWNSKQFHGTWSAPISMVRKVPCNSMELVVRQFRWHQQFLGIPNNSIEPWSAPISMVRTVPCNSMVLVVRQFHWHQQFLRFPWNLECADFDDPSSSLEFHGIPWNLECANFDDTSSFYEIPWNLKCANCDDPSSSMEFHGTWSAPISMAWAVPWNSMELVVRQFRWHQKFHGIPWNLECANVDGTSSSMEFHGTSLVIKYIKVEFAWILVGFEACKIPTEIDWWCWSTSYNAFIFLFWVR